MARDSMLYSCTHMATVGVKGLTVSHVGRATELDSKATQTQFFFSLIQVG